MSGSYCTLFGIRKKEKFVGLIDLPKHSTYFESKQTNNKLLGTSLGHARAKKEQYLSLS